MPASHSYNYLWFWACLDSCHLQKDWWLVWPWADYVGKKFKKEKTSGELYLVESHVLKARWLEQKPECNRKDGSSYKIRLYLWSSFFFFFLTSCSISFLLVPSQSTVKINVCIPPAVVEILAFWKLSTDNQASWVTPYSADRHDPNFKLCWQSKELKAVRGEDSVEILSDTGWLLTVSYNPNILYPEKKSWLIYLNNLSKLDAASKSHSTMPGI